jgi:hypothetical protein
MQRRQRTELGHGLLTTNDDEGTLPAAQKYIKAAQTDKDDEIC